MVYKYSACGNCNLHFWSFSLRSTVAILSEDDGGGDDDGDDDDDGGYESQLVLAIFSAHELQAE